MNSDRQSFGDGQLEGDLVEVLVFLMHQGCVLGVCVKNSSDTHTRDMQYGIDSWSSNIIHISPKVFTIVHPSADNIFRSQRNKCHCQIGARTLLGAPGRTTRNKKLLETCSIADGSTNSSGSLPSLDDLSESGDQLVEIWDRAPPCAAAAPPGERPWSRRSRARLWEMARYVAGSPPAQHGALQQMSRFDRIGNDLE